MSIPKRALPLCAVPLAVALVACGGSSGSGATGEGGKKASGPSVTVPAGIATEADVTRLVAASTRITKVPGDLKPALVDLPNDSENVYKDGCQAQDADTKVGPCVYGDKAGTRTIVLLGDSHAGMWLPAFQVIGKRTRTKVVLLSKPGCPAPDISFYNLQLNRPYPECDEWHRYVARRIADLEPDIAVVTSAYYRPKLADQELVSPAEWRAGLTKTLRSLRSAKTRTAVLGDIAYPKQSTPECLAAHERAVQDCASRASDAVKRDHLGAEKAAASATGSKYIDVTPWLCADECPPIVGNMAVYRNQFHITTVYASWLAGVLGAQLGLA